ncbi:MAG TPA: HDOD domain-containing protein, partial [Solirubrobacteraceae bacterium]|nr:HDOD domain-containing protein [Solirubrobacteraceae bacterium]
MSSPLATLSPETPNLADNLDERAAGAAATPAPARTTAQVIRQRHKRGGHAARLRIAFDAVDTFPALLESRRRMLAASAGTNTATAEIVAAVESDIALSIAVLRAANTGARLHTRADSVVAAVESLSPQLLRALAQRTRTFDFFEQVGVWGGAPARMRLHALATQRAADRVAAAVRYDKRDRLAASSLLHDIGKLVLARAYPGYPTQIHRGARTPDERVQLERRELGVDHAVVGAVLIERWGLPSSLAQAIEHHHDAEATGEAAIIRLADLIARYEQGVHVSPVQMLASARAVGLGAQELRSLLGESHGPSTRRQEAVRDCPLTERELGLLARLAEGSVYKQIAHELKLSVSTVRTHLHNVYNKLGVVNRAQA